MDAITQHNNSNGNLNPSVGSPSEIGKQIPRRLLLDLTPSENTGITTITNNGTPAGTPPASADPNAGPTAKDAVATPPNHESKTPNQSDSTSSTLSWRPLPTAQLLLVPFPPLHPLPPMLDPRPPCCHECIHHSEWHDPLETVNRWHVLRQPSSFTGKP